MNYDKSKLYLYFRISNYENNYQKPRLFRSYLRRIMYTSLYSYPFVVYFNAELAGHGTPIEWQLLNFIFVAISFLAIRTSAKNSSNSTVKVLFYVLWAILFGLIFNESIHIFHLPELATYISAFSLCCLHVYNLKYCQCEDENCCVNNQ